MLFLSGYDKERIRKRDLLGTRMIGVGDRLANKVDSEELRGDLACAYALQ